MALEQPLQQSDEALAIGMQKAEVSRAAETFRQHVLPNHPQELGAGKRLAFRLSRFGIGKTKGHLSLVAGDDILFTDDTAIKIAPEVNERLLAAAHGLAIDHPCLRVTIGQSQPRGLDDRQHLRSKDL